MMVINEGGDEDEDEGGDGEGDEGGDANLGSMTVRVLASTARSEV